MSEKLTKIELAHIAIFGTLWGASEITLGFFLHNLHVPFTGLIQTFIGTAIALTALKLTNKKRAVIYTAVIAAIQKMLSFTTIKIFPFIGILASAVLGQTAIYALGTNILGFIIAGALMCGWPLAQSLLFYFLAYSPGFLGIYQEFFNKIHLGYVNVWTLVKIMFLVHFVAGGIAAVLAWEIAKAVTKKIRENSST